MATSTTGIAISAVITAYINHPAQSRQVVFKARPAGKTFQVSPDYSTTILSASFIL